MTDIRKKRLGDLLVEEGLIDRPQLQSALAEQRKWGGRLGKHFIDLGILSEEVLIKALSKLLNLPSVDVSRLAIPAAVIDYVPSKTAERFNLIPINVIEPEESKGRTRRTLVVAMSDPTNLAALDEVRFTSGCDVRAVVSGDGSIERAIKTYYHGIAPDQPARRRHSVKESTGADESFEIVSSGDVRTVGGEDSGGSGTGPPAVVPSASPEDIASLGMAPLEPVTDQISAEITPRLARRLSAMLRVLVRKRIITEEEIEAELKKG